MLILRQTASGLSGGLSWSSATQGTTPKANPASAVNHREQVIGGRPLQDRAAGDQSVEPNRLASGF